MLLKYFFYVDGQLHYFAEVVIFACTLKVRFHFLFLGRACIREDFLLTEKKKKHIVLTSEVHSFKAIGDHQEHFIAENIMIFFMAIGHYY